MPFAGRTGATAEREAFVLLGAAERKFDTLIEAVQTGSDGDTIEIRGNGPFVSKGPIDLGRQSLTIRAAPGYQPVLKLNPYFRIAAGRAVIEGLSLQRLSAARPEPTWLESLVRSGGGELFIANCRLDLNVEGIAACIAGAASNLQLVNCQLIHSRGPVLMRSSSRETAFTNCLIISRDEAFHWIIMNGELKLKQSTIVAAGSLIAMETTKAGLTNTAATPFNVESVGNVLNVRAAFNGLIPPGIKLEDITKLRDEGLAHKVLKWHDERNVFGKGSSRVEGLFQSGPKNLTEWRAFWKSTEADAVEGSIRFAGGNLIAKSSFGSDAVAPADFRLRPDSAGYRAGPDGKDLGADIDFVGPGAAYERWKKTPDYQQWLRDTAQTKP